MKFLNRFQSVFDIQDRLQESTPSTIEDPVLINKTPNYKLKYSKRYRYTKSINHARQKQPIIGIAGGKSKHTKK